MAKRPVQADRLTVARFLTPIVTEFRMSAKGEREIARQCPCEADAARLIATADRKERRADKFVRVIQWMVGSDA